MFSAIDGENKQYHSQKSRKRVFFWGAGILFDSVIVDLLLLICTLFNYTGI